VLAFHAALFQASPVEALQASTNQNRRKAAPALGLLSKSLISSGLSTVSCKTGRVETVKK